MSSFEAQRKSLPESIKESAPEERLAGKPESWPEGTEFNKLPDGKLEIVPPRPVSGPEQRMNENRLRVVPSLSSGGQGSPDGRFFRRRKKKPGQKS